MSLRDVLRPIGHPVMQAVRYQLDKWKDYSTKRVLIKLKEKKYSHDVVRVGFIVQISSVWDKEKSIFERMCADERFDPYLLIVPNFDIKLSKLSDYDSDKMFFLNEVKQEKQGIITYKCNRWINLRELKFDYIFYGRPYDTYLPRHMHSDEVIKYAKTCYIPYATSELKNTVTRPKFFFRNLYIGFMEDIGAAHEMQIKFANNCKDNLQKFVSIGYPVFERCMELSYDCQYKKVMWAPRWTYDETVGGSHFFEYIYELEDYSWGSVEFIIRPHPLMWDNFIRTGLCDENYITERKSVWREQGIIEDTNKMIEKSFQDTDVLIADSSSVIAMFFMTSRPIIFCPKEPHNEEELSSILKTILPGLYVARSWNDLKHYLDMLLCEHKDVLRDKRKEIIHKYFKENKEATNNIVEYIYRDFIEVID